MCKIKFSKGCELEHLLCSQFNCNKAGVFSAFECSIVREDPLAAVRIVFAPIREAAVSACEKEQLQFIDDYETKLEEYVAEGKIDEVMESKLLTELKELLKKFY